jgi:hypothetical protein
MSELFAQAQFGGGRAGGGPPDEFWIVLIVVFVVLIAIGIAIQVFFLLTLSRCLAKCDPESRTMEPSYVWLNFIPCFGTVWMFVTVIRVADSLRNEFDYRGRYVDDDYGKNLGITYNVLFLLGIIPYIGTLFSIGGLVCWIVYWVKIAGYSKRLDDRPRRRRDDEFDDRDESRDDDLDDRPRRRRYADDDL